MILKIMERYTILTEEYPKVPELQYILTWLGLKEPVYRPVPTFEFDKWTGRFDFTKGPVDLGIFTGGGSCVDYIVLKNGNPVLLMESTKGDSGGNPYYQRIIKYTAARRAYPGVPFVMFYTKHPKLEDNSFVMSMRMYRTMGVAAVIGPGGVDLLKNFAPFLCFEEFQNATNSINAKENAVAVRIYEIEPNHYSIRSRLSKKDNKGISSDPQIGRVSGMCGTVFELDPNAKFTIVDHYISTISNCESKFWYANGAWDLRLDGYKQSTLGKSNKKPYYTEGSKSEKVATIIFQLLRECDTFKCVFANHAGSELEHLQLPGGTSTKITGMGKGKNKYPDVVMADHQRKIIVMLEGKVAAHVKDGDAQIDVTAPKFFKFMEDNGYSGYKYEKGLIVYGDTQVKTRNEILFQVLDDWSIKR